MNGLFEETVQSVMKAPVMKRGTNSTNNLNLRLFLRDETSFILTCFNFNF